MSEQIEPRRPMISANWKMNLNHFEAIRLTQELSYAISADDVDEVDISLHPPFTDLRTVQTTLESDRIPFFLGAQNVHAKKSGAFTGEISAPMLAKLNVKYVIVGHSERRQLFNETNKDINAKIKAVIASEMIPILCVGETKEERDEEQQNEIVKTQLKECLSKIPEDFVSKMVIAYEPIWAIGTGETATSEDAQKMCAFVREVIAESYSDVTAAAVRIQYGGSVKPTNIANLMSQPDIDGALVGGASLEATPFSQIVKYREHDLDD